jgi:septum formation protein
VIENARRKAWAGVDMAAGEGDLVLAVDTEVVLDGRVLGKATDVAQARLRLESLSGRTHDVVSGVVLIARPGSSVGEGAPSARPGAGTRERSGVARSRVTFNDLRPQLLDAYLASGEWRDRAGAYAVQGLGSSLVERVDGDLSNVIGLPVNLLLGLIPDRFDTKRDSSS